MPKQIAQLAKRFIVSSDPELVAKQKAEYMDAQDLLYCRLEGEFMVSYEIENGWVAITKDMLTEVLGAGLDVKVDGLPRGAAEVLELLVVDHIWNCYKPPSDSRHGGCLVSWCFRNREDA